MHFYDFFSMFYDLYNIYGNAKKSNKKIVIKQIENLVHNTTIDYTGIPVEVKESVFKIMAYHQEIQENKDIATLLESEPLIDEEIKKIQIVMNNCRGSQ